MPAAPIAKGLIIAASVLVAAGIAFYENPHVREWVDGSRRRLAVALHSLGDEIQPTSRSRRNSTPGSANAGRDESQQRRRRREETLRRNRAAMIRRAREEGVAVDLDELAAIGRELEEVRTGGEAGSPPGPQRRGSSRSFDDLVDDDGKLRAGSSEDAKVGEKGSAGTTTATDNPAGSLRHRRGTGSQGLQAGAAFANPFADEMEAQPLLDHEHDIPARPDTPKGNESRSRESTATLDHPNPWEQLVDVEGPNSAAPEPVSNNASITFNTPLLDMSAAAATHPPSNSMPLESPDTPAGAMTPTDDGFSTSASVADSAADDIGVMSVTDTDYADAMSEAFSDVGGAPTPSSWTDVGSDDGMSEDGHGQGH